MKVEVLTNCGAVRGVKTNTGFVFRGIPYAAPPTGGLRFHAPQPCRPWEGVRSADIFPPRCPQPGQEPGSFYEKEFYTDPAFLPPVSEDCLYLNVWAPAEAPSPCPVAVWFHGGAFINGFGSEAEFDGEAYAARGVILVTVNYRLGMFGWFCHPAFPALGAQNGNCGLLDQIAALNWVRENIAAFGGDPGCVTVFGQSAGAMSVQELVSSPLLRGKVQRAVIQSGDGFRGPFPEEQTLGRQEEIFRRFLSGQGVPPEELLTCPAERILELELAFLRSARGLAFGPVVDGEIVPCGHNEAAERGLTPAIPYLIGCTRDDISFGETPEDGRQSAMYRGAVGWCRRHAGRCSCYAYYFSRRLPGDGNGAFHSAELWYMFGTLGRCWRPLTGADRELSERMLDAWAGFMRAGDPGWAPYTPEQPFVREFRTEPEAGASPV